MKFSLIAIIGALALTETNAISINNKSFDDKPAAKAVPKSWKPN